MNQRRVVVKFDDDSETRYPSLKAARAAAIEYLSKHSSTDVVEIVESWGENQRSRKITDYGYCDSGWQLPD